MKVKVLHRRPNIAAIPDEVVDPAIRYGLMPMYKPTKQFVQNQLSNPQNKVSFASKILEFIKNKVPNIDAGGIVPILQKLKVPGLVIAGVAFVAGLAFLAYKLYKNWSEKKADETINQVMTDLQNTTPELLQVPGWYEQVKQEVAAAVSSRDEAHMVEQITKIKAAMIEKQKSMGKAVGGGIDLFNICHGIGGGIIMPI